MNETESAKMFQSLERFARDVRRESLRMTCRAGASHVGSCLSMAEILAALYGRVARVDPRRPDDPERDRVIVSKGHAAAATYAALALAGFFPRDWLERYCDDGQPLAGHVTAQGVPGVEVSTGSLGHGLPVGCGMALAARRARRDWRVFVVMSDGECDEGSVWEAALFAGHHRLANLAVVVDANGWQGLGRTAEVLDLEPLPEKWNAFGWRTVELDGHDVRALVEALESVRRPDPDTDPDATADPRPLAVIARTVKGRGVSFMEDSNLWHYRSPGEDDLRRALAELDAAEGNTDR